MGRLLPPQGVLLADAGAPAAWLGHCAELEEGQNFRKAGSFGPMAGHVIAAIGVKTAHPERPVVVGCGDRSYAMSGFAVPTAVENDIPVIWVIFNDGASEPVGLRRPVTRGESALAEVRNPDFAARARACGANGHRVDTLGEFEAAFRAALASGRPTVIDARITRWAAPHYSPAPDGNIDGPVGTTEARPRDL
jgi:acetolactate synthase-1/2/3 large subunit